MVLNLERDSARRTASAAMLGSFGVDFELYPAIDGNELSRDQKRLYSKLRSFLRYNRPLHWNEVACALSHIGMWEKVERAGFQECLILEDDIRISAELVELLSIRDQWLPEDWKVINFAHDIASPVPVKTIEGTNFQLCTFDGIVARTGAYLINQESARVLINAAYPVFLTADDFLGDPEMSGCEVHGIYPRCVHWDLLETPSSIWGDAPREEFYRASRRSPTGLVFRLLRRLLLRK